MAAKRAGGERTSIPRSQALAFWRLLETGAKVPHDDLCECGCGLRAGHWERTANSRGRIKGQPKRFVAGHGSSKRPVSLVDYIEEDHGFATPCWVWKRALSSGRYGHLRVNGKMALAHRHYYEMHRGSIPEGLQIDHLCCVTACVNPDHLQPVEAVENVRRSKAAKLCQTSVREIRARYAAGGVTQYELAAEYGLSQSRISSVLTGVGWGDLEVLYVSEQRGKGTRPPNTKLSDEQVRTMREMYSEGGLSMKQLAARFSVSTSAVHLTINRRLHASVA